MNECVHPAARAEMSLVPLLGASARGRRVFERGIIAKRILVWRDNRD